MRVSAFERRGSFMISYSHRQCYYKKRCLNMIIPGSGEPPRAFGSMVKSGPGLPDLSGCANAAPGNYSFAPGNKVTIAVVREIRFDAFDVRSGKLIETLRRFAEDRSRGV